MVSQLASATLDYFYDVFVLRWDLTAGLGLIAQALFMSRFVVQWVASERAGRSTIPVAFWILSLLGGLFLLAYAAIRHDPVYILAQTLGLLIYIRNLWMLRKAHRP